MRWHMTKDAGRNQMLGFGRAMLVAMLGTTALPAVAQEARYSFDIAPKSVTRAVNDIGRTAGLSIIILGDSAVSVSGNRVSGDLSVDQALSMLLGGTGLAWRYANASTVQVYDPARGIPGSEVAGAITLGTIVIEGAGNGATSFVARQSGTASKTGTPVVEVPQSVSVISASARWRRRARAR